MLTLICPFCHHGHTDALECLDSERLDSMLCENQSCGRRFAFLVRECLACGEESVFAWTKSPAAEAVAKLACQHCGAPFHDRAQQAEDEGAAHRI